MKVENYTKCNNVSLKVHSIHPVTAKMSPPAYNNSRPMTGAIGVGMILYFHWSVTFLFLSVGAGGLKSLQRPAVANIMAPYLAVKMAANTEVVSA
jgi:hypothetical protein